MEKRGTRGLTKGCRVRFSAQSWACSVSSVSVPWIAVLKLANANTSLPRTKVGLLIVGQSMQSNGSSR